MGHGVLKTCFRSVKIVSRFPKSCQVFPSEPNMHSASEIVTRLPNRVTILHFHEDSILSHIPTDTKVVDSSLELNARYTSLENVTLSDHTLCLELSVFYHH
jgi:hypothetical protein